MFAVLGMKHKCVRLYSGTLHWLRYILLALAVLSASGFSALRAENIRIGVQKTGTFAWELDVIRAHGLDKAAGLTLEVTDLATTEAGKIALSGGTVDMILSDWLWVSRERGLGQNITFYPYSSAIGAIMVADKSEIHQLADLKDKTLGVAGGPIDKSWLLVQAYAQHMGFDIAHAARPVFGARHCSTKKPRRASWMQPCNSGTLLLTLNSAASAVCWICARWKKVWVPATMYLWLAMSFMMILQRNMPMSSAGFWT